jgi:hypothetical protein
MLEKNLQGIPGAAAQIGKKLSIIQKVTTKDFRDTEDKMPVTGFNSQRSGFDCYQSAHHARN